MRAVEERTWISLHRATGFSQDRENWRKIA